jgi:sugar transferase (PEP-CTERM/EpsH1 system associated)
VNPARAPLDARPRVLHVVDSLEIGGLEVLVESLIERLPCDHAVCAVRAPGTIADRLRARGTPVEVLGRAEGRDLSVLPRLARRIRRFAPHVVHVHGDGASDALVSAKVAGAATVFTEHGWIVPRIPIRRVWLRRGFLKFADRVVAVSEHFRRDLSRRLWVPAQKVRLIRNSVPAVDMPTESQRATVRARLGVGERTRLIGSVGMMRPIKNYPALVEAFSLVARRRSDVALSIVGDGPQRGEIEATVRRLGLSDSVVLAGRQANARETLAALDVFAMASDMEGTSLALLEAAWCGLPIVATDVGGNAEVVESGRSGTLVPRRDPAALAEAVGQYLDEPERAAAHGARARERVGARYSFDFFLEAYHSLYRDLARGVER